MEAELARQSIPSEMNFVLALRVQQLKIKTCRRRTASAEVQTAAEIVAIDHVLVKDREAFSLRGSTPVRDFPLTFGIA